MKNFTRSLTVVKGSKDGDDLVIPPYGEIIHDNKLYFTTLAELYMEMRMSSIDEVQRIQFVYFIR